MGTARTLWMGLAALGVAACGGGSSAETTPRTPPPDETEGGEQQQKKPAESSGWPEQLIASPGSGPALYLHERSDAPRIGYVSPGTPFRIAGQAKDRLRVHIAGGLKVRAWMPVDRTAARVQKRGRVPDTPAYLGPNDVVRVRGPAEREGLLQVEVAPRPGRGAQPLGPYTGVFPRSRLGPAEVDPDSVEGPTPGTPMRLPAGQKVSLYDSPDGEVVATLPALDPPLTVVVLREQGTWKGVRAGVGPYVVGFVDARLTPADRPPQGSPAFASPSTSEGPVPKRLQAEADQKLWRVRKGSRMYFYKGDGERYVFGIFKQAGFAREMNRYEDTNEVDVFAAVDDRLALRGLVPEDALKPYEPGATSAN